MCSRCWMYQRRLRLLPWLVAPDRCIRRQRVFQFVYPCGTLPASVARLLLLCAGLVLLRILAIAARGVAPFGRLALIRETGCVRRGGGERFRVVSTLRELAAQAAEIGA